MKPSSRRVLRSQHSWEPPLHLVLGHEAKARTQACPPPLLLRIIMMTMMMHHQDMPHQFPHNRLNHHHPTPNKKKKKKKTPAQCISINVEQVVELFGEGDRCNP